MIFVLAVVVKNIKTAVEVKFNRKGYAMNTDKQVFTKVFGYEPDFTNDQDFSSMHSLWYLLENYNATCYVYDFGLDDDFDLHPEGVFNNGYFYKSYDKDNEYLRKDTITQQGEIVIECIKETLEESKINKNFLLKGLSVLTYTENHLAYKERTVEKIISELAPNYFYILDECKQAKRTIEQKIRTKTSSESLDK